MIKSYRSDEISVLVFVARFDITLVSVLRLQGLESSMVIISGLGHLTDYICGQSWENGHKYNNIP
jgi:hypothetical protein